MEKYKFYNLNDKNKESIYSFNALNIEEAYMKASQIKQLPIEEFKKIFGVEKK
jgi:hypothetical protein